MDLEQIRGLLSYAKQHKGMASEYLKSRRLELFSDVGFAPVYSLGNNTATNALTIPVRDPSGALLLVDVKDVHTGVYSKYTVTGANNIPVYNLTNVEPYRIVTEGVLNAESINQYLPDHVSSATLRASINTRMYHYLAASVHKGIIFAYDNDRAGQDNTQSAINFYKEYYPELSINVLDFPYNDLNEFLCKKPKSFYLNYISKQLKAFCK